MPGLLWSHPGLVNALSVWASSLPQLHFSRRLHAVEAIEGIEATIEAIEATRLPAITPGPSYLRFCVAGTVRGNKA